MIPLQRTYQTVGKSLALAFVAIAAATTTTVSADSYDAAVAKSSRPAADLKRDAIDHPAELLRLAGIKPGMHVADVLGGDGYYSELLGELVGPKGHVLMLNNAAFDGFAGEDRKTRFAGDRLPNVEYRIVDLDHMGLAPASLDGIVLCKVYHDLYWVDPTYKDWPKIDPAAVLDQLASALKPGGVLLLVDHSAKAGHGSADASSLHRIDEAFARADFAKRGLHVAATSDLLRRPDDPRDQVSYKPPMLGKTDKFVLVLLKGATGK
jgi:predicted methyltransferase